MTEKIDVQIKLDDESDDEMESPVVKQQQINQNAPAPAGAEPV